MEFNKLTIVCYTGGTCGDLISALIDPLAVTFNSTTKTVIHDSYRSKLKKPHLFSTAEEKVKYLNDVCNQYTSIPSHDLNFHVSKKHSFISITVRDFNTAMWAAQRFKQCHRPSVWEEMQKHCGANTIDDYAQMLIDFSSNVRTLTNNILTLEDIKQGTVVSPLEEILGRPIEHKSKNLYNNWLSMQNGT